MCNIDPPSPRHLLLTLLSAVDGGVMSAADAVKSCALFGISENSTRVALARLAAGNLVETAGRGAYRLGPEGRALGADVAAWREAEQRLRPWEGDWLAVLTGGLGRTDRAAVRTRDRALALLGLKELGPDLFVRPDNLAGGLAAARERLLALGLPAAAPILQVRTFDPERAERAGRLWNAGELERGYRAGRERLERSLAGLDALPMRDAARECFLLGDQAIRQLIFDPMLPAPLVAVEERRAFAGVVRRYDRAGRAVWQRFLTPGAA